MSDYWTAPCDCPLCVVANTPRVQFPSGKALHGVDAARFIASRARGMTKLSAVAEQLRKDWGIK